MLECENLTDQEQISFLEEFIRELNRQLDEIMEGHNYPREIKALTLRIKVLECDDTGKYKDRIKRLKEKLTETEKIWADKEPIVKLLQDERALYMEVLNKI